MTKITKYIIIILLLVLIIITTYLIYTSYFLNEQMKCKFINFLHNTENNWNYILPTELYKELQNKKQNNYFLLDIRKPEDYKKKHIRYTTNIYWKDLMQPKNLAKLPRNKEIILICYVGHTSSQILVMLKLLGYKVRSLKFGMGVSPSKEVKIAGWTSYGYETYRSSN